MEGVLPVVVAILRWPEDSQLCGVNGWPVFVYLAFTALFTCWCLNSSYAHHVGLSAFSFGVRTCSPTQTVMAGYSRLPPDLVMIPCENRADRRPTVVSQQSKWLNQSLRCVL